MSQPSKFFVLFRNVIASLAVIALGVGSSFMPGSVEGVYNSFLPPADGPADQGARTMLNLRDGKLISYRVGQPPAEVEGRYATSRNGSVEIYRRPRELGGEETLLMTAYPRLFITKFVTAADKKVHWQWKLPAVGEVTRTVHKQEIAETRVKGRRVMIREIFDSDFRVIRHEIRKGKGDWKVDLGNGGDTADEAALTIYSDVRTQRKISADAVEEEFREFGLNIATLDMSGLGELVGERRMGRAAFDSMFRDAVEHDGSADPEFQRGEGLIIGFGGRYYRVFFEDHPENAEGNRGQRFSIKPLTALDAAGLVLIGAPEKGGTSYNKELLEIFREAVVELRERKD